MDTLTEHILLNRLRDMNEKMRDDKDHRIFACFFLLERMGKQKIKW
jgi:hypothetical protein